ncbi:MAG: DHHA1 domain-containing protein [Kofleriaceae bacterium]
MPAGARPRRRWRRPRLPRAAPGPAPPRRPGRHRRPGRRGGATGPRGRRRRAGGGVRRLRRRRRHHGGGAHLVSARGRRPVEVAVASRDAGYGFSQAAVTDFVARGCTLVVTGDCGTSDVASIEAARAHGVDVIVIDHHTVPAEGGPAHPALALVNPLRADSAFPFRGMASVGLAFYVVCALRTQLRDAGHFRGRPEPDPRELLDLVALGTVADLVPLREENRILTALGLARLGARARPGLAALLEIAGVGADQPVDARTIAWKLGPRLNAPGRLGAALPALELLLASDADAGRCAAALEQANLARRAAQDVVVAEAMATAQVGACVVAAGAGWGAGVVGIVAAKLVEAHGRPAFVIAVDETTGVARGSARTCGGVDLYQALAAAAPLLERFGGHAAAAGLTVRAEKLPELTAALDGAVAEQVTRLAAGSGPIQRGRAADAELDLAEVDERLCGELAALGPFGQDNPPLQLLARGVRVLASRRVGDGSHLKLLLDGGHGRELDAIGFGLGEQAPAVDARVDVVCGPRVSVFRGRARVELEITALAPSA